MNNNNPKDDHFDKAPAYLQRTAAKGRVKGQIEISGPLLPGQVPEGETSMCVHCQFHWVIKPGSGMQRGFCLKCNGPTCGKEACETICVPFEKMIENMEKLG